MTETEKVIDIIENGAKNKLSLSQFIEIQIKEFEQSDVYKEIQLGEQYDDNKSEIINKKRTYIDQDGREVETTAFSNSKVQYPVAVKLKRQKTGFLLKQKMSIKEVLDDDSKGDKDYMQLINHFFNDKKHKLMKNTLDKAIVDGKVWWYIYVDKENTTDETQEKMTLKAKLRYASEIIPIWADREHENVDAIIVRYFVVDYDSNSSKKLVEKVEYHDIEGVRFFTRDGERLIPDIQKIEENTKLIINNDDGEGNPILAYFTLNGKLMTWQKIPFVYWKYNSKEHPLIFYIKSLIDEIEKLKSAVSDKLLDSIDGVNVVKNYQEEPEKFQKNLQTFKTIFIDEDGEYNRVEGTIDINAFKDAIEQLRKDVYDIGGGVDTESDKFGNNQSGVALQQLYNDLDLDCSNIESEFQSSLEYFMFFFNTFLNLTEKTDYSEKEIEFIFNKSMITDDTSKITNIKNSEGIISKKTQLANHPYVTDPETEIKQMEKEEKEELKKQDDYPELKGHEDEEDEESDVNE